jgi:hypothetical protein
LEFLRINPWRLLAEVWRQTVHVRARWPSRRA